MEARDESAQAILHLHDQRDQTGEERERKTMYMARGAEVMYGCEVGVKCRALMKLHYCYVSRADVLREIASASPPMLHGCDIKSAEECLGCKKSNQSAL